MLASARSVLATFHPDTDLATVVRGPAKRYEPCGLVVSPASGVLRTQMKSHGFPRR